MKRTISIILAVVMCLSTLVVGTVSSVSAKRTSSAQTRNRIVNFAKKYYMKDLNYFLRGSKHNKTMKDCFYRDGWSAMYCRYVLRSTIPKNVVAKCSSANISNWYKKIPRKLKKNKKYIPQKGDLVFFGDGSVHMGIVINVKKDKKNIYTIEGNCQVGCSYNIFDTRVQIHKYNMKSSWIHGYVKTI